MLKCNDVSTVHFEDKKFLTCAYIINCKSANEILTKSFVLVNSKPKLIKQSGSISAKVFTDLIHSYCLFCSLIVLFPCKYFRGFRQSH